MNHTIMLQVIEKSDGSSDGRTGQENGCASNTVGPVFVGKQTRKFDRCDKLIELHRGLQSPSDMFASDLPRRHSVEQDSANHDRQPASMNEFQNIRGKE